MDVTPGGHPGPRHTHRTKPFRKNIYDSHHFKCFCRTTNPKRMKRFQMSETLPDV